MEVHLEIIFKEEKIEYLDLNYDDALVLSIMMINAWVKRVMINIVNFVEFSTLMLLKNLSYRLMTLLQ